MNIERAQKMQKNVHDAELLQLVTKWRQLKLILVTCKDCLQVRFYAKKTLRLYEELNLGKLLILLV